MLAGFDHFGRQGDDLRLGPLFDCPYYVSNAIAENVGGMGQA